MPRQIKRDGALALVPRPYPGCWRNPEFRRAYNRQHTRATRGFGHIPPEVSLLAARRQLLTENTPPMPPSAIMRPDILEFIQKLSRRRS